MQLEMTRPVVSSIYRWVSIVLSATLLGSPAIAEARERTVAVFEEISAGTSDGIRVWVNEGATSFEIGDPVEFRFSADGSGYLTVIYLDAHGVATLLHPTNDVEDSRIEANQPIVFPEADANFKIVAELPTGLETLLAVATPQPITREELGVSTEGQPVVDSEDAYRLAQRLQQLISAQPEGSVAATTSEHRVSAPASGGIQHTARGIVTYFNQRHRSVRRPKLDFQIHFDTDSAELTDEARRSIDEIGKALIDPRLQNQVFLLEGHADDRGTDEHNLDLSIRRAWTVHDYVLTEYGVESERLSAMGKGEREPLVPGTDAFAREQNRRVSLVLER